jgi:hypothetical protein
LSQTAQQVQANARRKFDELRQAIDRFQVARTVTDNAALGVVPNRSGLEPALVAQRVRELRDMPSMERAVSQLYDLLNVLYDREPTEDELKAGPPAGDALGTFVLPTVPASIQVVAALAFGAWSLTSLFKYLQAHEERIQAELGIQTPGSGSRAAGVLGLLAVTGALAAGGYVYYRYRKHAAEKDDEDDEDEEVEPDLPPTAAAPGYHIHIQQQPPAAPPALPPAPVVANEDEDVSDADYEEVSE